MTSRASAVTREVRAGWRWGGVPTTAANSHHHQWRVLARERAMSNHFHTSMADQPGRILQLHPQGSLQQFHHSITTTSPSALGSGEVTANTKKGLN